MHYGAFMSLRSFTFPFCFTTPAGSMFLYVSADLLQSRTCLNTSLRVWSGL